MNHLHPVFAERYLAVLREYNQTSSPKVDELALWHADQIASRQVATLTAKPRLFGFWAKPQPALKKSPQP
jgi:hypothetical protein